MQKLGSKAIVCSFLAWTWLRMWHKYIVLLWTFRTAFSVRLYFGLEGWNLRGKKRHLERPLYIYYKMSYYTKVQHDHFPTCASACVLALPNHPVATHGHINMCTLLETGRSFFLKMEIGLFLFHILAPCGCRDVKICYSVTRPGSLYNF